MEKHSNISSLDSSNFLKEGAFLRWKGQWIIFEGPFKSLTNEFSNEISIAYMNFYDSRPTPLTALNQHVMDCSAWKEWIKPEPLSYSFQWLGPSREQYSRSFGVVQSQIRSHKWKKAVPIAFDRSAGTMTDDIKKLILSGLAQAPDTLIPYGFWKNGEGMIGLTPEILFHRKKDILESMALAGTEKKQSGKCQLLSDEKNLKEHDFVVQELFEKLKSLGKLEQSEGPQILELPTLFHLMTKFSVKLSKAWNDMEAISYLHPTSALGISPFKKWKELEMLPEQKNRNFFGAPFLVQITKDESVALVALRQIQWDKNEVRIGAGGGVVQESQEELEWLEILAKIDSVKKLMGIS